MAEKELRMYQLTADSDELLCLSSLLLLTSPEPMHVLGAKMMLGLKRDAFVRLSTKLSALATEATKHKQEEDADAA